MLAGRFRRTSCPRPPAGRRQTGFRLYHLVPLVGFLVPTIAIAYGIVLPRNGAAGVNELALGFAATLIGATITSMVGILVGVRR